MGEFLRDYLGRVEMMAASVLIVLAILFLVCSCVRGFSSRAQRLFVAFGALLAGAAGVLQQGGHLLRDRAEVREALAPLQQPAPWLADPEAHRRRELQRVSKADWAEIKLDALSPWFLILTSFNLGVLTTGLFLALRHNDPTPSVDPELDAEDRLRAQGLTK